MKLMSSNTRKYKKLHQINIMEDKEHFFQIIDKKFTHRLEVPDELQKKLMSIPFQVKQQKNYTWMVAASLLFLISVNIFAIKNNNYQSKKQYIESQYNFDLDNSNSYE
ncbi:MAG: hypothetical protein EBQ94_03510 [Flavobacteriales bacterium]|nr:hypothetical protein [Crocinitomicaceae bacterium]NBX79438.1 hypothetical protein [Flavobacteriales bacterium]